MNVTVRHRIVLDCEKCKRILIVRTGKWLQAHGTQLQFAMLDGKPAIAGRCPNCGTPYRLVDAHAAQEEKDG